MSVSQTLPNTPSAESEKRERVEVCWNQCTVRERDVKAVGVDKISNYFLRFQHECTSVITYKIIDSEELLFGTCFYSLSQTCTTYQVWAREG